MVGVPDDPVRIDPALDVGERTTEQELAAGRTAATPFAALASVAGVIAVLVVLALVLAVLAYVFLA